MKYNCYIQDRCKKAKCGTCDGDSCGFGVLITSAYKGSNIPKRFRKDILLKPVEDKFSYIQLKKYEDNILDMVDKGQGLYIYSRECGNGKTTWATKIARKYIIEKAYKKEHVNLVYFTTVADYLEELKQCFTGARETVDVEVKLRNADILILDDIGVEKTSDWVVERLYSLINYRINEEKVTIITSNLSLGELSLKLDNRIASRIKGSSLLVEFVEGDKR